MPLAMYTQPILHFLICMSCAQSNNMYKFHHFQCLAILKTKHYLDFMSLIDYVPQVIDWAKQYPLITMLEVANFSWNNIELRDILS